MMSWPIAFVSAVSAVCVAAYLITVMDGWGQIAEVVRAFRSKSVVQER
jgi:hypothetical protein